MNYEEYYSPEEQKELRNHALDIPVLKFAEPYKKILDVGCGAGVLASKLKELGKEVTCLDIKSGNVEFVKKNGIKVIQGDVNNLPFKDKEFSLAICQEVIEHIENPGNGIKELCRVADNVIFTLPKLHLDKWHLWDIDYVDYAGCITLKLIKRNG